MRARLCVCVCWSNVIEKVSLHILIHFRALSATTPKPPWVSAITLIAMNLLSEKQRSRRDAVRLALAAAHSRLFSEWLEWNAQTQIIAHNRREPCVGLLRTQDYGKHKLINSEPPPEIHFAFKPCYISFSAYFSLRSPLNGCIITVASIPIYLRRRADRIREETRQ